MTDGITQIERQHCTLSVGLLVGMLVAMGCSPSGPAAVATGAGTGSGNTPSAAVCESLEVTSPVEGALLVESPFMVAGTLQSQAAVTIMIDGTEAVVEDGAFAVSVAKPDGDYAIHITCGDRVVTRNVRVSTAIPGIVVEEPKSGVFIREGSGPVMVRGRVTGVGSIRSLLVNGQRTNFDPNGHFELDYFAEPGINHIDLVATTTAGKLVDMRRSFLYGHLNEWSDDSTTVIVAEVRPAAIQKAAQILEQRMTPEVVEALMADHMGRDGDIEVHEIKYDRLEVDFEPLADRIAVRMRLHDFGVNVTYHYNVVGVGGRIRGWAHARPAEVRADLVLRRSNAGGYDLEIENPTADLTDFELDLSDFYAVVEELVTPMVHDMGRDALVEGLRNMLIEDLLEANILEQEIEIFGRRTRLDMRIGELQVTPQGVYARSHVALEPLDPVKDAPGYWALGAGQVQPNDGNDIVMGMSVDLFNRLLGEAWRAGLMDADVTDMVEDDAPLNVGVLAGTVSPELLTHFDATQGIALKSDALMQPVVQIKDPATGMLTMRLGALRIAMSSMNTRNERIDWAILELSADVTLQPSFDNGHFTFLADIDTQVELVEAPLFPIPEESLEILVESLMDGLAGEALNDIVASAINFSRFEVLGIRIGRVEYGSPDGAPGFLILGMNLADAP